MTWLETALLLLGVAAALSVLGSRKHTNTNPPPTYPKPLAPPPPPPSFRIREADEQRRALLDEELKKPLVFGYADRPRADDLKALGLKESDFTPPARPQ